MSDVTPSDLMSGFIRNDIKYTMWDGNGGNPGPKECNLAPGGGCYRPPATLVTYLYTSYFASIVIVLAIVCTKTFSRK